MIPNIVKGADMAGLTRYLVGKGRANEHTNPHVIGGEAYLQAWYGAHELDLAAAADIAAHLDEPRKLYGVDMKTKAWRQNLETGAREPVVDDAGRQAYRNVNVWHCSLSLAPEEGPLSDEQWNAIASDFMDQMEFSDASGKAPARWVAIHHGASKNGNDHIHIAASMVREDGTRWAGGFRDYPKAQAVCRDLERKHGLVQVDGREHGTAMPRPGRTVDGQPVGPRTEIASRVRAAAVASSSEAEWIRRVRGDGMVIKPRFEAGTTDVVAGYRVALKGQQGRLSFYGGGQLGKDLSLPRVRENWPQSTIQQADEASAEWQAAFRGQSPTKTDKMIQGRHVSSEQAAADLDAFSRRLASVPVTDRRAWGQAARDVSGALSAWARFDPKNAAELRAAADVVSRSAQERRRGQGTRPAEAPPMGTALLFMAAASNSKPLIEASVLANQLLQTTIALADYHQATGNLRQAQAMRHEVVSRLSTLQLRGYQPTLPPGERETYRANAETRVAMNPQKAQQRTSPLPNELTPRPHTGARATDRGRDEHGR